MHKIILKSALILMAVLAAPFSTAQEVAPDALLRQVTEEVITVLKQDKDLKAVNPAKATALVETWVVPHFDFTRMTQIAMARNWRLATPEQRDTLVAEFKTLLVRTYSTALLNYRDQVIEFKRPRSAPMDTEVTVNSVVKQSGAEPVSMDYDLEKTATGWKVYNLRIAGVSLITTYRETFAAKIREAGVDGLIKSLSDKNRQGDARFRAQQSEPLYVLIFARSLLQGGI